MHDQRMDRADPGTCRTSAFPSGRGCRRCYVRRSSSDSPSPGRCRRCRRCASTRHRRGPGSPRPRGSGAAPRSRRRRPAAPRSPPARRSGAPGSNARATWSRTTSRRLRLAGIWANRPPAMKRSSTTSRSGPAPPVIPLVIRPRLPGDVAQEAGATAVRAATDAVSRARRRNRCLSMRPGVLDVLGPARSRVRQPGLADRQRRARLAGALQQDGRPLVGVGGVDLDGDAVQQRLELAQVAGAAGCGEPRERGAGEASSRRC